VIEVAAVLLPIAIGFAISPVPLIELILVLFSRRRVVNTIAFVVALLSGTALAVFLGAIGGNATGGDDAAGPSTLTRVIVGVLGLALLLIGLMNWRNRADESQPKVLATIYEMGPVPVAVLAVGVALFNPKNLPLLLAAGQTIGASTAPLLIGIAFVLVANSPYLIAAGYSLLGGQAAADRLDRMRAWLIRRNRLIMGILCIVLGLLLLLKALSGIGG
jgi:hypothetical protein